MSLGFFPCSTSCSSEKTLPVVCPEVISLAAGVLRAEWWEMIGVLTSACSYSPNPPIIHRAAPQVLTLCLEPPSIDVYSVITSSKNFLSNSPLCLSCPLPQLPGVHDAANFWIFGDFFSQFIFLNCPFIFQLLNFSSCGFISHSPHPSRRLPSTVKKSLYCCFNIQGVGRSKVVLRVQSVTFTWMSSLRLAFPI